MSINGNRKYLFIIIGTLILIIFGYIFLIDDVGPSLSALLPNSVEVEKDTDLTYYLNVYYDGVVVNCVASSDTTVAYINSDVIYVVDNIPVGLLQHKMVQLVHLKEVMVLHVREKLLMIHLNQMVNGMLIIQNILIMDFITMLIQEPLVLK